jgi:hypothetical protein
MSRAFTIEGDGWSYCPPKRQTCMYADDQGNCLARECVLEQLDPIARRQKEAAEKAQRAGR